MKPKLYLETTIPSYLTGRPSRDLIVAGHQQITEEWWRTRRGEFDLCVSQFVIDEAAGGDSTMARLRLDLLDSIPLLEINDAVLPMARTLLQTGVIPAKAARDAAHIAIAAVHGVDYLMTWNCTHIANATISRTVRRICEQAGFLAPVICTPEELLEITP